MNKAVPSACPHDCPDACSFLVYRTGGRNGITIESGKVLPLQRGWICPKGKRWERRFRSPGRLKYPLKKEGSGWREISWETAWGLWAAHLQKAVEKHGPLANFVYQSAGSQFFSKKLGLEVFSVLGGYSQTAGSLCGAGGGAGLRKAFGHTPTYAPEELEHAMGILLWGRNAFETHPHLLPILKDLRNRSGDFAAIEIRTTPTTKAAGKWWRVRPGSDAGLALLLCRMITDRNDAAANWKDRARNPRDFLDMLEGLNEGRLLQETGMQKSDLEELYRWIMEHKPLAIYGGYGAQRYHHGSFTFHALTSLALLLGAFSERGTGVVFGKDEVKFFPERLLRIPAMKRRVPIADWHLVTGRPSPPIKTVLFSCANPAKQGPDCRALERAIVSMDFSVCIDLEMTETAALCDLVLPAACFLEEGPDWRGSWWHTHLLRSEKVVEPPGEALPETTIMAGLGEALGLDIDIEAMRKRMDRTLLDMPETEALGEGVYRTRESHEWSDEAEAITLPRSVPSHPASDGDDRLRLVTVHTREYINGQTRGLQGDPMPVVTVSPEEGNRRGLHEGDKVEIRGAGVSIPAVLQFDKAMDSGYCVMVQGSGKINRLTRAVVNPGYGAAFHESFVLLKGYAGSDCNA
ncbi:MAG: molybdopterin-containing oxidoreductase family protein [Thermovirgaceae bacterium]